MAFSGNGDGQSFQTAFEITTLAQLREINDYLDDDLNTNGNHDVHFKLMNDLDATFATQDPAGDYYNAGSGWDGMGNVSISSDQFWGHLHYNGFSITGLKIDRDENRVGLFRYFLGSVYNFSMPDVDITNASGDAGALAGRVESPTGRGIFGFKVTGNVTANNFAGGLFGSSQDASADFVVRNGTNYATIHAGTGDYAGGVCGRIMNADTCAIDKCIGIGDVTSEGTRAGGIVGRMATAADVTNCFYLDTADGDGGQSNSGTEKTQAELQDIDTYTDLQTTGLDEAYDMIELSNHDGFEDTAVWAINDGQDYPILWFEVAGAGISANVFHNNVQVAGAVVTLRKHEEVEDEAVGTGDGSETDFTLDNTPVYPGSVTVRIDGTETTDYTIDYNSGTITFDTAPDNTLAVTADYTYLTVHAVLESHETENRLFSGLAAGTYHRTAEWNDNGIFYNSQSDPFLVVD